MAFPILGFLDSLVGSFLTVFFLFVVTALLAISGQVVAAMSSIPVLVFSFWRWGARTAGEIRIVF